MSADPRAGRPRASSREVLAEAACELFLEKGYEATSVADITSRAGVSRSSFFNYFSSKSDVLWSALDKRIDVFRMRVRSDDRPDAAAAVRSALVLLGDAFAPDALALAFAQSEAMGIGGELEREASLRRSRIARTISTRLRVAGVDPLRADVAGAAHAGGVLAAIEAWATDGAGRAPVSERLHEAMDAAAATLPRDPPTPIVQRG